MKPPACMHLIPPDFNAAAIQCRDCKGMGGGELVRLCRLHKEAARMADFLRTVCNPTNGQIVRGETKPATLRKAARAILDRIEARS